MSSLAAAQHFCCMRSLFECNLWPCFHHSHHIESFAQLPSLRLVHRLRAKQKSRLPIEADMTCCLCDFSIEEYRRDSIKCIVVNCTHSIFIAIQSADVCVANVRGIWFHWMRFESIRDSNTEHRHRYEINGLSRRYIRCDLLLEDGISITSHLSENIDFSIFLPFFARSVRFTIDFGEMSSILSN